jgi:hypothetical protein
MTGSPLGKVKDYILAGGGKQNQRLPFWNASDDSPTMNHATFVIPTDRGTVHIEAYEQKEGVPWPNYKCSGDLFKNKFAVNLQTRIKESRTSKLHVISISGFVDISDENLEKFIGQFMTR